MDGDFMKVVNWIINIFKYLFLTIGYLISNLLPSSKKKDIIVNNTDIKEDIIIKKNKVKTKKIIIEESGLPDEGNPEVKIDYLKYKKELVKEVDVNEFFFDKILDKHLKDNYYIDVKDCDDELIKDIDKLKEKVNELVDIDNTDDQILEVADSIIIEDKLFDEFLDIIIEDDIELDEVIFNKDVKDIVNTQLLNELLDEKKIIEKEEVIEEEIIISEELDAEKGITLDDVEVLDDDSLISELIISKKIEDELVATTNEIEELEKIVEEKINNEFNIGDKGLLNSLVGVISSTYNNICNELKNEKDKEELFDKDYDSILDRIDSLLEEIDNKLIMYDNKLNDKQKNILINEKVKLEELRDKTLSTEKKDIDIEKDKLDLSASNKELEAAELLIEKLNLDKISDLNNLGIQSISELNKLDMKLANNIEKNLIVTKLSRISNLNNKFLLRIPFLRNNYFFHNVKAKLIKENIDSLFNVLNREDDKLSIGDFDSYMKGIDALSNAYNVSLDNTERLQLAEGYILKKHPELKSNLDYLVSINGAKKLVERQCNFLEKKYNLSLEINKGKNKKLVKKNKIEPIKRTE